MFETIVRYKSANERAIFENHYDKWDSILVSAHLLSYAKGSLPLLLRDIAQERSLSYYIDPIVSEFRIGSSFRYESGDLRSWHRKYAAELGDPLESILEEGGNVNARYIEEEDLTAIAESVVDFQENFVYNMLQDQTSKYEDLDVSRREVEPKAIIPWVHKLETEEDHEAYRTILSSSKARASQKLRPVLYTSTQKISRSEYRMKLVELLSDFDIGECFILFEDLDKHDTRESEYRSIIDLVYDISESGIDPYFYYGDFYSNLLHYFGLQGTAFSPLHGEQFREKEEVPGDGGMQSRYYLDEVKDFLQIPAAVDIMTRAGKPLCDCEFCSRHFSDWRDIIEQDQDDDRTAVQTIMMKHRIATRWQHTQLVQEESLSEVLNEMREDFEEIAPRYSTSQQVASRKELDYIQRWIHAAEERSGLSD